MNPLHLDGWGVKIRVENLKSRSELEVTDGREDRRFPTSMRFRPRRFPYDSIIVDGHSGYISLQAFHWLSRNKVPVFIMDYNGTLISSILPPMAVKADVRSAQIQAANDPKKKFTIAKAFVEAKIARSLQVLHWLSERYDIEKEVRVTKGEAMRLSKAFTVPEIRTVEGRTALRYWEAFRKVLPEHLNFEGRMTTSHQNDASDPANSALNYGYAVLESECRKAINSVGLEVSVGFLHDVATYQTKESLAYDLQEPYRWLVDVSVIQAFESRALDWPSFYFTADDYRYRFVHEAKERFIQLLRTRFNERVAYKGERLTWSSVIAEKTSELARFLTGKSRTLDFTEPSPILERNDNRELRAKILALNSSQAKQLGIPKQTLHDLRTNARGERPFRVYGKVREKLQSVAV